MNNSKVLIFLSCLFAATLTAPLVTASSFNGGHSFAGHPGMVGRPGMGMPGHPGMFGRPGMGMVGHHGMGIRTGNNWHNHFDHDHDHFHNHNEVIFIGSFGFPWWWGWGPWWGWYGPPYGYGYYGYGYGYPYGYGYGSPYGYGDPYGYGQYGQASHSRVAELQRRLAHAGYYHGSIDGVLGPRTRQAIRAYARNQGYASSGQFLPVTRHTG